MPNPRSVTVTSSTDPDRRAQTRQQILDATRGLLAQGEAFAKMSIQRIVDAAGISRATFYLHFHTKRELIAALAQNETGGWAEIAAPFLNDPQANRAALEAGLVQLLQLWREHRAVIAGIIELAEYDEDTRQAWRDTMHGIAQSVSAGLQQRRPGLAPDVADQLGRLLVWAGERYLHHELSDAASEQDRLLIASLSELFWKVTHD